MKKLLVTVFSILTLFTTPLLANEEIKITNVTIEVENISEVTTEDLVLSVDGYDEPIIIASDEITYIDSNGRVLN